MRITLSEKSATFRGDALPRRHRLFAAIVVETAIGLATEPAGFGIFHEQWAGAVLIASLAYAALVAFGAAFRRERPLPFRLHHMVSIFGRDL